MDAVSHGAGDGMKVSLNVIAMLIGVIALIAFIDFVLGKFGMLLYNHTDYASFLGMNFQQLSLKEILGSIFSVFAYAMGVPGKDVHLVGQLLGTKFAVNEFVAYSDLSPMLAANLLEPKTLTIVSIALCGFANFSSIAIQVGGIGELAPSRRSDLAALGFKALICGTMASYLSATVAGILM